MPRDGEVHAITCGISLLTNAARSHLAGEFDLGIPDEVARGIANPRKTEEALSSLGPDKRQGLRERLLKYAETDPRRASAELNALAGYLQTRGLDLERASELIAEVLLLASDTVSGSLAAGALADFLRERGLVVSVHSIRGFQSGDYDLALGNLKATVQSLVERHGDVLLNLTGGFKAEVAALSVLAAESGLRAYYIHESSREVVFLPTGPELKVRTTKEEKLLALLTVLLAVPFDSILGFPWFLIPTASLAFAAAWLAVKRV